MLLNLVAMLYAGRVMHGAAALVMRLAGAVLGVLQVILAIEIILRALQQLGLGT
jgi:small neutral amino acid transporter SnatA (MarC family)